MANLISHPFRLGPTGAVVTRPEDSEDYYAELIAVMVGTVPGERDQVPLFGVNDPVFGSVFDPHQLVSKLAIFGPPVTITSVTTKQVSDTEQDVVIGFVVNSF